MICVRFQYITAGYPVRKPRNATDPGCIPVPVRGAWLCATSRLSRVRLSMMPARLAEGPCYGRLASQLRPPLDIMAAVGFPPSAPRFSVLIRINGIIPSKMICIYIAILTCFYARSQTRGRASPERTAYLRAGCPSGCKDLERGRLHASTSPSRTPIRIVRMLSYPPSPDCAATCLVWTSSI